MLLSAQTMLSEKGASIHRAPLVVVVTSRVHNSQYHSSLFYRIKCFGTDSICRTTHAIFSAYQGLVPSITSSEHTGRPPFIFSLRNNSASIV